MSIDEISKWYIFDCFHVWFNTFEVLYSFIKFFGDLYTIDLICEEVKTFFIKRKMYRKILLFLSMFKLISFISWQISMEMNGLNKINLEISMKKKMVYENLESVVITWKFARFSRLIFSAFEFVGEKHLYFAIS